MRVHLLACAALTALLFSGCGSAPVKVKPSPLPDLPGQSLSADRVWSVSSGAPVMADLSRLRPAIAGNRVLVAGAKGVLRALDDAGKTVWEQRTGLPVSGGLTAGYGRVFAGTAEGDLAAFGVDDGLPVWKKRLSAAILAPAALDAGHVVVQTQDGRLHVLEAATGNLLWSYDLPMPALSVRGYAMPLIAGDLVIAASAAGKIVALDLKTGAGRWESQLATPQGRTEIERLTDIDGDMLLTFDEKLYVGGYQGQLAAFDLRDRPETVWEYPVSTLQSLAEGLGNVYVAEADGVLVAVDAASGKAVWRQDALKGRGLSAPAVVAGVLAVGDAEGYIHLFSQADGKVLGRARTRGAVVSLQVMGERLLVSTDRGVTSSWVLPAAAP